MLRDQELLEMERPVSARHAPMRRCDRAAQFAPFAALTGYDSAIRETGRLTDERIDFGEETKAMLDMKQQYLSDIIADQPEITVTYFVPDEKKAGGAYVTVTGNLKRIEEYERMMILTNGKKIPMDEIADIEADIFRGII